MGCFILVGIAEAEGILQKWRQKPNEFLTYLPVISGPNDKFKS